jgi:hypothetical protein
MPLFVGWKIGPNLPLLELSNLGMPICRQFQGKNQDTSFTHFSIASACLEIVSLRLPVQADAATAIQAHQRGRFARRAAAGRQQGKALQRALELQGLYREAAATKLQACFRGYRRRARR